MFKTIGFLSREVGFLAKKWVLLMKKTNPYGKSIGKSPKTAKIGRKIAKSGWISTIFVENLTKHQARAYSGREALNRAHREAFRDAYKGIKREREREGHIYIEREIERAIRRESDRAR